MKISVSRTRNQQRAGKSMSLPLLGLLIISIRSMSQLFGEHCMITDSKSHGVVALSMRYDNSSSASEQIRGLRWF